MLDHSDVQAQLMSVLESQHDPAATMLEICLLEGHKILLCGNGGSAAASQHLAGEFVVRFIADRKAYPALALSADSVVITAAGNDYGYQRVFARQIQALGAPGDVLVALSTSGKSVNVLEAISMAKFMGLSTLGISGAKHLGCDVDIAIPSTSTARIQEMTILCGHLLVEELERRLPK